MGSRLFFLCHHFSTLGSRSEHRLQSFSDVWENGRLRHNSTRNCLRQDFGYKQEQQSYGRLGDELQTLCEKGQLERALDILSAMDQLGKPPPDRVYLSLLKACGKKKALLQTKHVHAHLGRHQSELNSLLGDQLVIALVKCGSLEDALLVFQNLPHRTVFSWTTVISAHTERGLCREALKMHQYMQEDGIEPNHYTFVSLLKACGCIMDLEKGKKLHADVRRKNLTSNVFIGSALVSMYGKCGSLVKAESVFSGLSQLDVVTWNTMLSVYVEHGQGKKALQLYRQMQEQGEDLDELTFVISLQACVVIAEKEEAIVIEGWSTKVASLEIGEAFHADAVKKGFASKVFVANTLVSMYGKCGSIVNAVNVFVRLSKHNVVSWNAMLSGYVDQGQGEQALQLYRQVQEDGVVPDDRTFVVALQACGIFIEKKEAVGKGQSIKVMPLEIGQALHADAWRKGFASDPFVGNTLVSMYGKWGSIIDAENVFCGLSQRNIVSWNAMLSTYVGQGQGGKALQLYRKMQKEGVSADKQTFMISLQACCALAEKEEAIVVDGSLTKIVSLKIGQALHNDILSAEGFPLDFSIGSTLVTLYGKCGNIFEAEYVFGKISQRDVTVWCAMLAAYIEDGQGEEALKVYRQMQKEFITVNDIVLICLLQACSQTGCIEICRQLHFTIVSAGYDLCPLLASTLVHAYGSCGSIIDAQAIFDRLLQPNIVSWSACMTGHTWEGNCEESLRMFEEMQLACIKPDGITFVSILFSCSHAGLIDKGAEYFKIMKRDYGLIPNLKHYACLVDILGRAGDFTRLGNMLWKMPMQPDLTIYLCLLGACRAHGNLELAKQVFDCAMHLQPKESAVYVLMSNIYADAGLQHCTHESANKYRQKEDTWKKPDQSWIEHE